MAYGISRGGSETEKRFIELTGATKAVRAADGDAILEGHLVEVKAVSSDRGTVNQVRATKFITLVAFDRRTSDWYVVPAHEVVRLVSGKRRGQHTENPFESATLSLTNLRPFKVRDEGLLRQAVLEAVAESAQHPQVREAMRAVLAESGRLAEESRTRVRKAFGDS